MFYRYFGKTSPYSWRIKGREAAGVDGNLWDIPDDNDDVSIFIHGNTIGAENSIKKQCRKEY